MLIGSFHLNLIKGSVNRLSSDVLGLDYSALQKLIYPIPSYRTFVIKKRSGGDRLITEPREDVKLLQLKALEFLSTFTPHSKACVHGFVQGRSILTNAKVHCERKPTFVLNLDLKDFFPSINFFRVRGLFTAGPFDFAYEVATVLAQLCTYQGTLPQGAPTSAYISNLICRSLDRDLMSLARRHRCSYTRYADDITFSFSVASARNLPSNICTFDGGVLALGEEISAIIKSHSFEINEKKTRISSRHSRQEVTGLIINKFPNVRRKFVDSVRGALHAWETYGYAAADLNWQQRVKATTFSPIKDRVWPRQTRKLKVPKLYRLLWGKLLYIRMIRSRHDELYDRLARKYNRLLSTLMSSSPGFKAPLLPICHEVSNRKQALRAVYLVEWIGDYKKANGEIEMFAGQGTAFAYRDNNIAISCEHVFRFELPSGGQGTVQMIEDAQITVRCLSTGFSSKATIVDSDMHRDIAVLKIADSNEDMRHFISSDVQASNDLPVHLLGFPNWTPGRDLTWYSTSISITFPKKGLRKIEIRELIRKGNSGGPLLSDAFDVIGFAQEGATQADGNNECLCVSELDKWLNEKGVLKA